LHVTAELLLLLLPLLLLQYFYFVDVLMPEQRTTLIKGCYPYIPRIAPGECLHAAAAAAHACLSSRLLL
jgi:hypothetical protein